MIESNVTNGKVIGKDFLFESVAEYQCNDGFYLQGATTRTCQASGMWSGVLPMCQRVSCPEPGGVCSKVVCPKPGDVGNGYVEGTDYTYKAEIIYHCNEGHVLSGARKRKCGANRQWSPSAPSCFKIACPTLSILDHGYTVGMLYKNESVIVFICDKGYQLEGKAMLTCKAKKEWSDIAPTCVKVKCSKPEVVHHGIIKGLDYSFGANLEYECKEGYVLKGAKIRTCTSEALWSKTSPKCVIVPHVMQLCARACARACGRIIQG